MIQMLLGEKIEQMQKFFQDGTRIPVTEIAVPDNAIVQIKTEEKDKYFAAQIGIGKKKAPQKALLGHAKKNNLTFAPYVIREVKIAKSDSENMPKSGDLIKIEDVFQAGDIVDITGISKGKGFAGVVKRHHFKGGPKTHGQSDRERAPGSVGQTTRPGRVYKGKRMAGHKGHATATIKNLKVVSIDEINKKLYVAGLIPGAKNSIVSITRTKKNKKIIPLFTPSTSQAGSQETKETKKANMAAPSEAKPTEKTQNS